MSTSAKPVVAHTTADQASAHAAGKPWRKVGAAVGAVAGAVLGCDYVYGLYYHSEWAMVNRIVAQMEQGVVDPSRVASDTIIKLPHAVPREQLHRQLMHLLRPAPSEEAYGAVLGEVGTGKSKAIRTAIYALDYPKGVIYCNEPHAAYEWAWKLASSLGFRPSRTIVDDLISRIWHIYPVGRLQPVVAKEPEATWNLLLPVLERAAEKYKDKHGRPPVLVVDGAEQIRRGNPQFYQQLQWFAKVQAASSSMIVIFVCCGTVEHLRELRNVWRMQHVLEVRDVSTQQAVEYVKTYAGLSNDHAEELVQTVSGGRFTQIHRYLRCDLADLRRLRQQLFNTTASKLEYTARVSPTHPFFRRLVEAADKDEGVSWREAEKLLDEGTLAKLVAEELLSLHVDYTYTFAYKHVEAYIRSQLQAA